MSPFAAIFDRHQMPLEPAAIAALGGALSWAVGSRDSQEATIVESSSTFAFGKTTSAMPRASSGLGEAVCLGAEAVNVRQLADVSGPAPETSVAETLVGGLARHGTDLWSRIRGPFGMVLFEPSRHVLHLARDPLGSRALFFSEAGALVLVADQIETLLRWGGETRSLDPDQLVRFFGLEQPRAGRTYFRSIREVPPGSAVEFASGGRHERRFWSPAPDRESAATSDAEYAERFRSLLRQATSEFLAAPDRLGIMLSGGIDSTSLAVLAARATEKGRTRLGACSWVFDELGSCDERSWIAGTLASNDFEIIQIPGDGCWPLVDLDLFSNLPGAPEENPYRALKSALYSAASEQGRSLLLNGGFADLLYRGGSVYFRDLVRDGRWGTAARGLARQIGDSGWRSAAGSMARVVRATGRRKALRPPPDWLTADAKRRWCEEIASSPALDRGTRDVLPYVAMEGRGLPIENSYAAQQGVQVASPYWTLEWVEFMLSLPAHQVFRPGTTKFIAREAMRDIVPEPIRVRQQPTLLDPLFDRGVFEREAGTVQDLLHGGTPIWQDFVDPGFVADLGPESPSAHKVVLWNCVSLELWRRKHGWEVG